MNSLEKIENSFKEYTFVNVNVDKKYIITKRLFDIVGSGLGLILFLPVFLVFFILMKIEALRQMMWMSKIK